MSQVVEFYVLGPFRLQSGWRRVAKKKVIVVHIIRNEEYTQLGECARTKSGYIVSINLGIKETKRHSRSRNCYVFIKYYCRTANTMLSDISVRVCKSLKKSMNEASLWLRESKTGNVTRQSSIRRKDNLACNNLACCVRTRSLHTINYCNNHCSYDNSIDTMIVFDCYCGASMNIYMNSYPLYPIALFKRIRFHQYLLSHLRWCSTLFASDVVKSRHFFSALLLYHHFRFLSLIKCIIKNPYFYDSIHDFTFTTKTQREKMK